MPGNLAYQAYQLIWMGFDWLYPPICGGCGSNGTRWCIDCQSNSQVIGDKGCFICGDLVAYHGLCIRCKEERPACNFIRSWAVYAGPIRNAVLRIKYGRNIGLSLRLAALMMNDLTRLGWQIDLVLPVPLSLARFAERGYNQAALLAWPIAQGLRLPYLPNGLRKIRDTQTQVGLPLDERRINVLGAFTAKPSIVGGKQVLVIDDVTTSGSTMNECALVLKAAGAQEVYGYSLARAGFQTHQNEALI